MTKDAVRGLLKKYQITPDDTRGQNFLLDEEVLDRITAAAQIQHGDIVLEIGPGIGNLTTRLAERAGQVIAVEADERFRPPLETLRALYPNLKVHYRDILRLRFEDLGIDGALHYRVAANIPYYLTSRLIQQILSFSKAPERVVLLLQKEVAERICARVGDHTKLSLAVQLYGAPQVRMIVPRTSFYPMPQVDSAILVISDIHVWQHKVPEKKAWQIIRIGFSAKRKKLANNLMAGLKTNRSTIENALKKSEIQVGARAQDLSISQWINLANELFGIS